MSGLASLVPVPESALVVVDPTSKLFATAGRLVLPDPTKPERASGYFEVGSAAELLGPFVVLIEVSQEELSGVVVVPREPLAVLAGFVHRLKSPDVHTNLHTYHRAAADERFSAKVRTRNRYNFHELILAQLAT